MNEIQEGLNQREKDDGAFFCSYLSFMEGYRYVRRVIERSGQSAYLLLCTMTDGKGVPLEKGERLGKVAEELEQAIRNSLRRGDMFTRYSDNQFLMLLLGVRREDPCKRAHGCHFRQSDIDAVPWKAGNISCRCNFQTECKLAGRCGLDGAADPKAFLQRYGTGRICG